MTNLHYLSKEERRVIEQAAERDGAVLLWLYARLPGRQLRLPGKYGRADRLSLRMQAIRAEMDVTLTHLTHPITCGLPEGFVYGTASIASSTSARLASSSCRDCRSACFLRG